MSFNNYAKFTDKIIQSEENKKAIICKMISSQKNPLEFAAFFTRRRTLVAAFAVILVCVGIFAANTAWLLNFFGSVKPVRTEELKTISIKPLNEDDGYIDLQTSFLITCGEEITIQQLKSVIRIEPELDFSIKKSAAGFELTPNAPFESDSLVALTLINADGELLGSWAFQTKKAFKIVRTLPADMANCVPEASGIEIVFSHSEIEIEPFKAAFSIEPIVDGTFMKNRNSITFVPNISQTSPDGFERETVYTVTIDKSLEVGGESLEEDKVFSFSTAGKTTRAFIESPFNETFLSSETPVIALRVYNYGDENNEDVNFITDVYRFESSEAYIAELSAGAVASEKTNIWQNQFDFYTDVETFDKVMSFESKLITPTGSYNSYIVLPDSLPKGYYAVKIICKMPDGEETTLRKLIQISDTSVFYSAVAEDILFWINDAASGKPIEDAQVSIKIGSGDVSGKTAADGTVKLEAKNNNAEKTRYSVISVKTPDGVFADTLAQASTRELTGEELYYSYIYTDRAIYKSTDKINVWGFVRPRQNGGVNPEKAELIFEDTKLSIPLNQDGSFKAEIPISKMNSGTRAVELYLGDFHLYNVWVKILDYVKPIYVGDISFDKLLYISPSEKNRVNGSVKMSFFDETPAPDISLGGDCFGSTGEAVTDAKGIADFSFIPEASYPNSWRPDSYYCFVRNLSLANEYTDMGDHFYMTSRDYMLKAKAGEQKGSVEISLNKLDASRITSKSDVDTMGADDYEILKGAPVDAPVTAELHKIYYTKNKNGSYYDYIQKQTVTLYDYTRHDDLVETYTVNTEDGKVMIKGLPTADGGEWLYLNLIASDSAGGTVEEIIYYESFHNSTHYYDGDSSSFVAQKELSKWRQTFEDGEDLAFDIEHRGELVKEGRILYATAQTDIMRYKTQATGELVVPYSEDLVPGYMLFGAYFDGKHVRAVTPKRIDFDTKKRELEIDVVSDKLTYLPGESATVTAVVREKENGKPAANVAVNISVVDEAVFAVAPHELTTLESLYRYVFYPNIHLYTSYIYHNIGAGNPEAEGGGGSGGGTAARRNFIDTAQFFSEVTDKDGTIKTTFKLPDSITKWRISTQGISPELKAGSNKTDFIVTKPFFLSTIQGESYIEGDDIVAAVRCFGTELKSEAQATYYATITGSDGFEKEAEISGKAGELSSFNFGKLKIGEYKITLKARSGELTDGIELPLEVVKSGVAVNISKNINLSEGININPVRYPVRLHFFDKARAFENEILSALYTTGGTRTEQRVARRFALESINGNFGDEETPDADLLHDVEYDGGFKILPWADREIELTALMQVAVPEYIPNGDSWYFNRDILDYPTSTSAEVASAYMGLCALKKPVLRDVITLLENSQGFEYRDKLKLVAGLALIGDHQSARKYYDELVTPFIKKDNTHLEESLFSLVHSDEFLYEDMLSDTAVASIAASTLGNEDAQGFIRFLNTAISNESLFELEKIIYLRKSFGANGEGASFSYMRDGERQTVELNRHGETLSFSQETLEKADFKSVSGSVEVTAYYVGEAAEASKRELEKLTVKKTVAPIDATVIKPGSMVKTVVEITVPSGAQEAIILDDYISSNMRFVQFSENPNQYLVSEQNGRINVFCCEGFNNEGQTITISYLVRCVLPGEFVEEQAFAKNSEGLWGASKRGIAVAKE